MVRNFSFKWYKNEKYGKPTVRTNSITVINASADTGHAAKAATDIFCKTFGNLKVNTIVSSFPPSSIAANGATPRKTKSRQPQDELHKITPSAPTSTAAMASKVISNGVGFGMKIL